jgi:hypothetical protein
MTPIRTSLAALALAAIAAPALAQSTPTTNNATNINPQGSPGTYAPRLPEPQAGEDATVRRYLEDARRALATGRTGEAQEALEHAETRLLDRSVAPSRINDPSRNPQANAVAQARLALGAGDRAGAMRIIDASLGARPVAAAPPPPPLPYPPVPAPQAEIVPPPPAPHYRWEPGHWHWNGAAYVWVAGHYVTRRGPAQYVPGQWVWNGNAWLWEPAHWAG